MVADTVNRLAEPHPADVELTFAGRLDELPHPVARAMVQLVGEAVSNALRHSGSAVVRVEVRRRPDDLLGAVVDDGAGLDPDRARPGRGLVNLRERAFAAGGATDVTSRPGRGTSGQHPPAVALTHVPTLASREAPGFHPGPLVGSDRPWSAGPGCHRLRR